MPGMEHADDNMVSVAPGKTGEIVWRLTKSGKIDFDCVRPSHFDASLKGFVGVAQGSEAKPSEFYIVDKHRVTIGTAWSDPLHLQVAKHRLQNVGLAINIWSYFMSKTNLAAVALSIAFAAPFAASVHAQAMDHGKMGGMTMPGMKMDGMAASKSEGEVRKVDKEAKKITLKHGDIKNLDMPGMTMVFQVKDAALLDKVKAGDKVSFTAEKADGAVVVTSIDVVR